MALPSFRRALVQRSMRPARPHRGQLKVSFQQPNFGAAGPNVVPFKKLQLSKAENQYALDNFRDTARAVAPGNGEFIHAGRLHSHSSGSGDRGCVDSCDSRTQPDLLKGVL